MFHPITDTLQLACRALLYSFTRVTRLCAEQHFVVVRRYCTSFARTFAVVGIALRAVEMGSCYDVERIRAYHILANIIFEIHPRASVKGLQLRCHIRCIERCVVILYRYSSISRRQLMTSRMAVRIATLWVVCVFADICLVRVVYAVGVVAERVGTRCTTQVARVQRICHPQSTVLCLVKSERVVSQLRVRRQRFVCCNLVVCERTCCRQLCPISSQCRLGSECRKLYCLSKERLALGCVILCAVYYDVSTSVVCCILVKSRYRFRKVAACSACGRSCNFLTQRWRSAELETNLRWSGCCCRILARQGCPCRTNIVSCQSVGLCRWLYTTRITLPTTSLGCVGYLDILVTTGTCTFEYNLRVTRFVGPSINSSAQR